MLMSMVGAKALAIVNIDGIYYFFSGTNAIVTHSDLNFYYKYTGSVVIPETVTYNGTTYSVTRIGDEAFKYSSELTSVAIPNSVTSIGKDAFYDLYGLSRVNISDLSAWCIIEFESSSSNPLRYADLYLNEEEVKDLIIPNSVTSISSYAFYGCYSLTSVTIPNSVTSIGSYAFAYCI